MTQAKPQPGTVLNAFDLAALAANLAESKKASDVMVLDTGTVSYLADYFVICTGDSPAQIRAIVDEIDKAFKQRGQERLGEWLGIPAERQVYRNELLLKLFFGSRAELPFLRSQIEARRNALTVDLARYHEIEKRVLGFEEQPGKKFWLMTVRYGIAEAKALMVWCEDCLKEMQ